MFNQVALLNQRIFVPGYRQVPCERGLHWHVCRSPSIRQGDCFSICPSDKFDNRFPRWYYRIPERAIRLVLSTLVLSTGAESRVPKKFPLITEPSALPELITYLYRS